MFFFGSQGDQAIEDERANLFDWVAIGQACGKIVVWETFANVKTYLKEVKGVSLVFAPESQKRANRRKRALEASTKNPQPKKKPKKNPKNSKSNKKKGKKKGKSPVQIKNWKNAGHFGKLVKKFDFRHLEMKPRPYLGGVSFVHPKCLRFKVTNWNEVPDAKKTKFKKHTRVIK